MLVLYPFSSTVGAMPPEPPIPLHASAATYSRRDRRHRITVIGTSPCGDGLHVEVEIRATSLTAAEVIAAAIVAWSRTYVPPPPVERPGHGGDFGRDRAPAAGEVVPSGDQALRAVEGRAKG